MQTVGWQLVALSATLFFLFKDVMGNVETLEKNRKKKEKLNAPNSVLIFTPEHTFAFSLARQTEKVEASS